MRFSIIILSAVMALGCSGNASSSKANVSANTPAANSARAALPVYGYEIVKSYPHDGEAFTQGLIFHNGFLYESTGEHGESSLRKVEIETGKVLQKVDQPKESFSEGITLLDGKIYQIVEEGICRVFDINDFKLIREFSYQGEGWGLTTDGTNLFMTDSTHVMRVLNPETFRSVKMNAVMREDGKPLMRLNELEYVKGEIWANIWHSEDPEVLGKPNTIARIDPATGKLLGWINLDGISPEDTRRDRENVLNGIAYDPATDRIFVTGKNWKKLFEIKNAAQGLMTDSDRKFMMRAIELARIGMESNAGGPFGCVVVKDGEIVGEGNNCVTSTNDPTAHAEVVAIRNACGNLGTFQLDGCAVYTSCEPCPMCLGAIYWSRPAAIFYAGTREDAAIAGFDDEHFYNELERPNDERELAMVSLLREEAQKVFQSWAAKPDKTEY